MLEALDKGHTRDDFERVARHVAEIGLTLAPTFVAFTPWTTVESYCDLLQTIDRLELVDHVSPIQLAIRLLVTEGSRLLELTDIRQVLQPFNPRSLTYPWAHRDARRGSAAESDRGARRRDALGAAIRRVRARLGDRARRGRPCPHAPAYRLRASRAPPIPYLNEPWYC